MPWNVDKLTRWPWRSFDDAGWELIAVQCCGVASVAFFTCVTLRSLNTVIEVNGRTLSSMDGNLRARQSVRFLLALPVGLPVPLKQQISQRTLKSKNAYWWSLCTSFSLHAWSSVMSWDASWSNWTWGTLFCEKNIMNVSAKSLVNTISHSPVHLVRPGWPQREKTIALKSLSSWNS